MMDAPMLTTVDNPYDPFTHFDEWFIYDVVNGYNSCSYLARISHISDTLSDEENVQELERAIDEILKYDFLGIYKKVYNNSNSTAEEPVAVV